jgi:phosphoribosylformylglycinamidine synthase
MRTEDALDASPFEPPHRLFGLTDEEYQRIEEILGRAPNRPELAMYSVMWSEHCSYKSSRIHLRSLPTEGPHVLVGPGEGAGVVKVDDVAVALRIESHNHPSFVEPFQGAATGIGGIVRDVLSVGARPIALLDPLRFGPVPAEQRTDLKIAERNRFLTEGVVSGISSYGNCIGVPTVGGEVKFEDCYSGNPLVNVMCLGVAPAGRITRASAEGSGNAVILLGSKTGRDGIGGVSVLASATFDETALQKRPSVQVGDPFTEKLLIEACLELYERGLVVGVQDLGGAGLCCATSETAAKASTGMRIDISKVPLRERDMEPFEILTSESQERMLIITRPADLNQVMEVCERWGLSATEIGEVISDGRLEVFDGSQLIADVPAASLGDGPLYDRPRLKPSWIDALAAEEVTAAPDDLERAILALISSPNVSSKRWVWEQYDHQVMLGTVVKPGHDASVLRIPGAKSRIAVTTDGNGRFCYLDPYLGTSHIVAEAYRNLSAVGAEPIAITNCLNFGNPERPEVMWQFVEVIRGLGDSCRSLATPVTGGNVSFYNEAVGVAIYPTPIVGMIGVIPEGIRIPALGFRNKSDVVAVVGRTRGQDGSDPRVTDLELGGSEYARTILGKVAGRLPSLDLQAEAAAGTAIRNLVSRGLVSSVHDVSEGGLAVAVSEACIEGRIGAHIVPPEGLAIGAWLFSESASRYLISFPKENLETIRGHVEGGEIGVLTIGEVGGDSLSIGGEVDIPISGLIERYENSFQEAMGYAKA